MSKKCADCLFKKDVDTKGKYPCNVCLNKEENIHIMEEWFKNHYIKE